MLNQDPIGIFDSGVGGLTVAQAVTQLLPHENIIYFGDTVHLPYGDKSTAAIQAYAIRICDYLLKQHCKVILIACHSASSAAYELIKEYVGNKAHVINVIDPVIDYIQQHDYKKMGLIGTKQTVNSQIYKLKIDALNKDIQLFSLATPLLAPMIEEGYYCNKIAVSVIEEYLNHPSLSQLDALILACTHYPLIKKQISLFYKEKIEVIDSAQLAASALNKLVSSLNLKNNQNVAGRLSFYVSDYTESFAHSAALFFQNALALTQIKLD